MADRRALPSSVYTYMSGSLTFASAITPACQTIARRRVIGESRLVPFKSKIQKCHTYHCCLALTYLATREPGKWSLLLIGRPCVQLRLLEDTMNIGQLLISATHSQGRKEFRWQAPGNIMVHWVS